MKNMKKKPRKLDCPHRNRGVTDIVYGGTASMPAQMAEVKARFTPPASEYNIYWGELHGHSNLSDGLIDIDTYFQTARDLAKLDFCALTDHDHGGVGKPELWNAGKWDLIQNRTQHYHQPGQFVTILGYERDSYPWYNNLVLYYREDVGELVRGTVDGEITRDELSALLKREDIIAVPHTTTLISSGTDFDEIPLELMTPLIEVYSKWGTSEYFGNSNPVKTEARGGSWQDALARGARMGCIAGSDEHGANPGLPGKTVITGNLRYEQPGLCAVLAKELTRKAIFDALKSKRCYGTSGARIKIDFRINDAVMGSSLQVDAQIDRQIYINIQAEDPLETITIVKNNIDYVVFHVDGGANAFTELFYDSEMVHKTDYYYCRIQQTDGRNGWSSPIWVDTVRSF